MNTPSWRVADTKVVPAPQPCTCLRPTVLVAEDHPSIRRLLEVALLGAGFAVLSASDGQAAMETAVAHGGAIDLALLDVQMPVLDGPGALLGLRRLRPGLRVWFLSGHSDYPEELLLGMGAERFIAKPFSVARLIADLRAALLERPPKPG